MVEFFSASAEYDAAPFFFSSSISAELQLRAPISPSQARKPERGNSYVNRIITCIGTLGVVLYRTFEPLLLKSACRA